MNAIGMTMSNSMSHLLSRFQNSVERPAATPFLQREFYFRTLLEIQNKRRQFQVSYDARNHY